MPPAGKPEAALSPTGRRKALDFQQRLSRSIRRRRRRSVRIHTGTLVRILLDRSLMPEAADVYGMGKSGFCA
jgi:hypothetical protein